MPQKPSFREKRSPRKRSSLQTHSQPCKPSCLVNLTTQKKLTEISTLAQTTCVVLQWIPAHTGIRGNEIADQLAKEGREKEQPHHICHTEKSKLLSVTRIKPPSTARLEDTTQTMTHSISCHDSNRSSFASEQATGE